MSLLAALALLPASTLLSQDSQPPPVPESRIHDGGSVFQTEDATGLADEIRKRLDDLQAETGCRLLIATVTTTTGTSPRLLADQFAATWLKSDQVGAVLVYERSGNRLAISATEPVGDVIPDYAYGGIEQSMLGEDREDMPPAEIVFLAVNDLTALFRKYYGEDAGRDHPAIRLDKILMAIVAAAIIALVAAVAALHWRAEKARA